MLENVQRIGAITVDGEVVEVVRELEGEHRLAFTMADGSSYEIVDIDINTDNSVDVDDGIIDAIENGQIAGVTGMIFAKDTVYAQIKEETFEKRPYAEMFVPGPVQFKVGLNYELDEE